MTEAQWLAATEPRELLDALGASATDRKLRLIACCGYGRWAPTLSDARSRAAIAVSERFADGLATELELDTASFETREAFRATVDQYGAYDERCRPAEWVHYAVHPGRAHSAFACAYTVDPRATCVDIRDIFGNPFRPVSFSPSWQTGTAITLARQMYVARDFSAMPILADALQDAGCDNADVLDHRREPNATHVCGCWVVDRVLSKE